MKNNVFVIIASFITTLVIGQVPNISYPNNSYVFTTGGPINPLHITNIGGSVPVGAYGQVSTFVGTGEAGAVDGSSTVASFNSPYDVATDALGNFYVADNNLDNHPHNFANGHFFHRRVCWSLHYLKKRGHD